MFPEHKRLDPLALLVAELSALVDPPVFSDVDASLDPRVQQVHVLQVPTVVPAGRLSRWSFTVDAVLMTYADTPGNAWSYHTEAADAILELSGLASGQVKVSNVQCTAEPSNLPGRTAPEWPGLISTYSMTLRHER